ncbi:hypothetical protein R3P38DRAFT_3253996 [Favolaschia claudopus]|uniref:SAM domain-containing protein n=1 Tax=Favolaschia claudopus TaxID=2862362 RepID=A0AAW0DWT2_9AGAR
MPGLFKENELTSGTTILYYLRSVYTELDGSVVVATGDSPSRLFRCEFSGDGIGGAGGVGEGPTIPVRIVWLADADIACINTIDTGTFCAEYQLRDEIRRHLDEEGLNPITSLLYVGEGDLKNWGFDAGSIAEIRWALKKMLSVQHPGIRVLTPRTATPDIEGGTGGRGGHGGQSGGAGGCGMAPRIATDQLLSWKGSRVRGGIGGIGGASGIPGLRWSRRHTSAHAETLSEVMPVQEGNIIEGGRGGAGGWGPTAGGIGGEGRGVHIPMLYVGLFRKIKGGTGGAGGESPILGGRGGDGDAPELTSPLCPISEDMRRRIPAKSLESLGLVLPPPLLKLLKDRGFSTVGGLLEARTADLLIIPDFKRGYCSVLKAALARFCNQYIAKTI